MTTDFRYMDSASPLPGLEASQTYLNRASLQLMEWEVEILRAEKEQLETKLKETRAELYKTDGRLQVAIKIYKRNVDDLQDRIQYLEAKIQQGNKELTERVRYLEQELKESHEQLQHKEPWLKAKEEELRKRESELEWREKECDRITDFFSAGNDVSGLILDLQWRIKKQEEELQQKDNEIRKVQVRLEREKQEMLAIKQTLANQAKEAAERKLRTLSEPVPVPRNIVRRTPVAKRPAEKQASLPLNCKKPQKPIRSSLQQPLHEAEYGLCTHPYDVVTPPEVVYRRLPFSLEWNRPYPLDPKKKLVSGVAIYGQKQNTLYFSSILQQEILAYKATREWESLPPCPHKFYGLTIIEDNLTAVGGEIRERIPSSSEAKEEEELRRGSSYTNKLLSLFETLVVNCMQWVELYPPMPTQRANAATVCTSRSLIVAGGDNGSHLQVVEVMDIASKQWFTAASLPNLLSHPCMALCKTTDRIYLTGDEEEGNRAQALYNCSVQDLLGTKEPLKEPSQEPEQTPSPESQTASEVWKRLPNTPNTSSTLVTIDSHVAMVGGLNQTGNASNEIYYLDVSNSKWEHIAHISAARHKTMVGFNPSAKKLVVIGGFNRLGTVSTVEIANYNA